MIVESEDFFAPRTRKITKVAMRPLSLLKRPPNTYGGETWDIVLNGANTNVSFTKQQLDDLGGDARGLEMMIRGLEYKLIHYHYALSDGEKKELRKLISTLL